MNDLQTLANQVQYIENDSDVEELAKGDKIMRFLELNKGLHDKVVSIMQNLEGKIVVIRNPPKPYTPKVDPQILQDELLRLHRHGVKQNNQIKKLQLEVNPPVPNEVEKYRDGCLELEKKNKELQYKIEKLRQFNLEQTPGNQKRSWSDFEQRLSEMRK